MNIQTLVPLVDLHGEEIANREHASQPPRFQHEQVADAGLLHAPEADVVRFGHIRDNQ